MPEPVPSYSFPFNSINNNKKKLEKNNHYFNINLIK